MLDSSFLYVNRDVFRSLSKRSILNVWQGSKYASLSFYMQFLWMLINSLVVSTFISLFLHQSIYTSIHVLERIRLSYLYLVLRRTERHRFYEKNSQFAYDFLMKSIFSDLTELPLSSFKTKSPLSFHNVSALSKLLLFLSSECVTELILYNDTTINTDLEIRN